MSGISSDMLVLPIGGYSMVLGIQWLITLGDIMRNFRQLKVEFTGGGQKVSLRDVQPRVVKMIHQGQVG